MVKSSLDYFLLFQMMADEAILGFAVFEGDSQRCVYVNKMSRQMLEVNLEKDITGIEINELFPSQSNGQLRSLTNEMLQNEGLYQDIYVQKTDGRVFIANVGVRHLEVNKKNHLLLMLQDITVQKKLQREITAKQTEIRSAYAELLIQNKRLKDLDIAKNRFIALTTHELRTPLSAMLSSSEILKFKLYDDQEQLDEFIDIIYEQGQHLNELVNDILDFAKIQAGKMDFFVGQHDLYELLQTQIDGFQNMADANGIQLELIPPSNTSTLAYYDELRLKQVVSNMITNAIKYNKEHGYVKVRVESESNMLMVIVEDSGKGISPEERDKVFDEFETLGKVALHHKGTGLGMPISKRLIEAMGGSIDFTSEVNVGTTFWICVPTKKILPDDFYRSRSDGSAIAA